MKVSKIMEISKKEISFWLYRNKKTYDDGRAELIPATVELHKVKYPDGRLEFETIVYQADISSMKLGEDWCKQLFGFFPERGSLWKIIITAHVVQRQEVKTLSFNQHRKIAQRCYDSQ